MKLLTDDLNTGGLDSNPLRRRVHRHLAAKPALGHGGSLKVVTAARLRLVHLRLDSDRLPLARDAAGVVRVGGTRVSLDSLIAAYGAGLSMPEMAEGFPDVSLSDIHAAIAYYLRHREEVDDYVQARRSEAKRIEDGIRVEFPQAYRRVEPEEAVDSPQNAEG